ncbi:GlcG/HbpS family heme-binding protein [Thioalkalivibrio sulfidiphilus]|uniref:GlcG/HbpS family heme-binding protein n=1 Tax=Thioalkalivibrio sulfidiphilus TaxID=1033854 RepID=UPI0003A2CD64|nr:heme-binding protein [Thioalkalivibrio sulfidiphilus]
MKMIRSLLAGAVILGAGAVAVAQADAPVTVDIKRLSLEMANRIALATIEACRAEGVNVAVTVVDRGGHPQVVMRDTLAMDLTLEISRQKAYTAMSFNAPLSQMEDRFTRPFSVGKVQGIVFSAGGLPIHAAGSIVGGVGVSGAPSGELDEKCAAAGLEAVQIDLDMG